MDEERFSTLVNLDTLKKTFLECPVCFELYDEKSRHPRLLPCLHSLCYTCISKLRKSNKIECPLCRRSTACTGGDVSCFPKDNTRRDLLDFFLIRKEPKKLLCNFCIDGNVATHRCKDCEDFLCKDCVILRHGKMIAFRGHIVISIVDLLPSREMEHFKHQGFCSEDGHEKEVLKLYCKHKMCKKPVCMMCAVTTHDGHGVCNINTVFDEKKTELLKAKGQIKSTIEEVENNLRKIQQEKENVNIASTKTEGEIKAAFDLLRGAIKKRENELCYIVGQVRTRKQGIFALQIENLKQFKTSCVEACNFLDHSLSYKNAPAFLEISPSIELRLKELKNATVDKHPHENSQILFKNEGMGQNIISTVNGLGKVLSTSVYPPLAKVNLGSEIFVGDDQKIVVELSTYNNNPLVKERVNVCISGTMHAPRKSVALNLSCTQNGIKWECKWSPKDPGTYSVQVQICQLEVETLTRTVKVREKRQVMRYY